MDAEKAEELDEKIISQAFLEFLNNFFFKK